MAFEPGCQYRVIGDHIRVSRPGCVLKRLGGIELHGIEAVIGIEKRSDLHDQVRNLIESEEAIAGSGSCQFPGIHAFDGVRETSIHYQAMEQQQVGKRPITGESRIDIALTCAVPNEISIGKCVDFC